MEAGENIIRLIEQAQEGDRDNLNRLAMEIQGQIYAYL